MLQVFITTGSLARNFLGCTSIVLRQRQILIQFNFNLLSLITKSFAATRFIINIIATIEAQHNNAHDSDYPELQSLIFIDDN